VAVLQVEQQRLVVDVDAGLAHLIADSQQDSERPALLGHRLHGDVSDARRTGERPADSRSREITQQALEWPGRVTIRATTSGSSVEYLSMMSHRSRSPPDRVTNPLVMPSS
jgi:hypothetical protein